MSPSGIRYESGDRRDPFLDFSLQRKKVEDLNEEEDRGQPPPGIAGMAIAQVVLLGTSYREGTYTAVFRGTDTRAYFLREGDKVFDGYLKKIDSDSVMMVRVTKLRSGKVINQEVTKRLREP